MHAGAATLALGAAGALATANAWHPFSRRGRASGLCFPAGLVASELPMHVLAGQLAATAGLAAAGGLRSPAGRLGLALAAASGAGLRGLQRAADASAAELEAALVEGLGPGYRQHMAAGFAPPAEVPLTRAQVANPLPRLRRRYASDRDLAYGEAGRRNRLDVWRRADLPADAGAPVLVQVHGGAWTTGNKAQQAQPLMGHLAERGWVCVAVNYRLAPRHRWPEQIIDVKRALAWVKERIADHGGDPGLVVVTGGSAGGHLAALAALTPGEAGFQPGFEEADTTVQAAVPLYGVYDFTNRDRTGKLDLEAFLSRFVLPATLAEAPEVWDRASPMSWVRPDAPPFFVVHGTNDGLVPVEQARSFARLLRQASSQPVVFAELARAQHAFDVLASVRTHHVLHAIDRFLAVVRSSHGARPVPPAPGAEGPAAAGPPG